MNRREFFSSSAVSIAEWTPWLAVLGFRFCPYTYPQAVGYAGWVEWCGRCVWFVPLR